MGVKCGSHKDISVVEDMGEGFYGKSKGVSHKVTKGTRKSNLWGGAKGVSLRPLGALWECLLRNE
jgi:hypothetical protein